MKTQTLGGIEIPNEASLIMNGGGCIKNMHDLETFLKIDDIPILEVGSITILQRDYNPGETFYAEQSGLYTVNSLGMPNLGMEIYDTEMIAMKTAAHAVGKKIIVNIASVGKIEDYVTLADVCINKWEVDGIVINLGCPNVYGQDGTKHPIISFADTPFKETLSALNTLCSKRSDFPVWIKLSPLVHNYHVTRTVKNNNLGKVLELEINYQRIRFVADIINSFSWIKAVVSTNTIPNVKVFNNGNTVLGPNPKNPDSTGGLAGTALTGLSIEQSRVLKHTLREDIHVIGAGGIYSGDDMARFINEGRADGVQIVSAYYDKGPEVFATILAEYATLVS